MDPGARWSVSLLDTSTPVEDPQKSREIEFGLDNVESLNRLHLTTGTYAQGARQRSPFWTDRKKHILCITRIYTPGFSPPSAPEFAIDYGSICAIASENKTTSYIPWDLWKHRVTPLDRYVEFTMALEPIGPRVLVISKKPYQGPSLRSFDFTPGACRFTKQIDTSFDDEPRYAIRRAKLTDTSLVRHEVRWALSEDNALAFTVSSRVSFGRGSLSFIGYWPTVVVGSSGSFGNMDLLNTLVYASRAMKNEHGHGADRF